MVLGSSGVSSPSAMSPGDESTAEASDKKSRSNVPFRGVVKEGFRKAGAGVEDAPANELWLAGFGVSNPPIKCQPLRRNRTKCLRFCPVRCGNGE